MTTYPPLTTEVLIAGAGPTGLTLAAELARRQVRVLLVDAAPGPFAGSRGKGLQPRTLEVFHNLGLAGRLLALGRSRLPIRFYDAAGSYRDVDMSAGQEATPDSPFARLLLIAQWRTETVLRQYLASLGVEVVWNCALTGLTPHAGAVTATLGDGRQVIACYVVGCDGGSSTVRKLVGARFLGSTDESRRTLLGDFVLEGLDREHWTICKGDTSSVAICPLPATDSYSVQIHLAPGDATEPSLAAFQAYIDQVPALRQVRLLEATWLSKWRLNERLVEAYRYDRVLLAGDAAHVHSPAGGQGLNTGVQDAANLGWKLAAVLRGAPAALLDTYGEERLPIAADVLGFAAALQGQDPGQHGSRTTNMLQLGVSYRGCCLAPAWEGAGPQPGDRAPDASCQWADGQPTTLFTVQQGGRWTLYGVGQVPTQSVPPAVRVVVVGRDLLDAQGHFQHAYQAEAGEWLLIRPDGHIGLRTRTESALAAYWPQVVGDY